MFSCRNGRRPKPDVRFGIRLAAMLCLIAIAVLSTLPGVDRPHTGASGNVEHFIAYLGTALFLASALGARKGVMAVALLSLAAAFFEVLQIFIDGRQPGVDNWLASTAGAMAGALLARFVGALARAVARTS